MKKRRIFAVVMAAVMTLSMAACGETQTGNENPTTVPTTAPTTAPTEAPADPTPTTAPVVVQETSIDFEDGNYGFAMVKTSPRKADLSTLSLGDHGGSKALLVENQGGEEMHLGIDIDAILGDKVTEVRSISMTVGTEHPDGEFAAVSGGFYVATGEKLTETKVADWSVYMAKKNPKTETFTLPEGVAFTAGNDNYITLALLTDTGAERGAFYVDDIRFFDANGNVLKGDTSVVMEAPKGFLAEVEEDDASGNVVKVAGDDAYKGDWGESAVVPQDVLAQFAGQDVTVKAKFELTGDKDYYIWAPKYANNWTKIGAQVGVPVKTAAEEGDKYHAQADGTIVIDDQSITELTFTIPAALVDTILATDNGSFSGMTYGVVVYEVVLVGASAASAPVVSDPVVEAPAVELTGTVVYTGSTTMVDTAWWTEKELTLADLFGDIDPATVEGVKFTSNTDFQLGYNSSATGAWAQPSMAAEHAINDIAIDGFALKLFLSKGDGIEYTINWEVYGKDAAEAEAPAAADLVISFKDLTAGGYGYNAKVNGDAVDVSIASQYQEIQYILPEAVDLAAYTKLIVDVTSNAQLDIKLVNPEAAVNEYSHNTPFLDNYTAEGTAITEPIIIDLTAYADFDLSQINFMAMGNDTTFTIKSITFTK